MKTRPVAPLVAFLLVPAALATWSSPAHASCAASSGNEPKVVFEGRAVNVVTGGLAGEVYLFDVDRVEHGTVASPAVVTMSVDVETVDAEGRAVTLSSSVSAGPAPKIGERYRVEARLGTGPAGGPALYVNACGGRFESLGAGPAPGAGDGPAVPPAAGTESSIVGWSIAAGALSAAGTLLIGVLLRRRKQTHEPIESCA